MNLEVLPSVHEFAFIAFKEASETWDICYLLACPRGGQPADKDKFPYWFQQGSMVALHSDDAEQPLQRCQHIIYGIPLARVSACFP